MLLYLKIRNFAFLTLSLSILSHLPVFDSARQSSSVLQLQFSERRPRERNQNVNRIRRKVMRTLFFGVALVLLFVAAQTSTGEPFLLLFSGFVHYLHMNAIFARLSEASPMEEEHHDIAVKIPSNADPDELAARYGYRNKGQIGSLEGYYLFQLLEEHQSRREVATEKAEALLGNVSVCLYVY